MAVLPCEERLGGTTVFRLVHQLNCALKDEDHNCFWKTCSLSLAVLVVSILVTLLVGLLTIVLSK
jgi:hypothetical protein